MSWFCICITISLHAPSLEGCIAHSQSLISIIYASCRLVFQPRYRIHNCGIATQQKRHRHLLRWTTYTQLAVTVTLCFPACRDRRLVRPGGGCYQPSSLSLSSPSPSWALRASSVIFLSSDLPCIEGLRRQEESTCWTAMLSDANIPCLTLGARCPCFVFPLHRHCFLSQIEPESRLLYTLQSLGGWANPLRLLRKGDHVSIYTLNHSPSLCVDVGLM